jgi:hypothetical protein
MQKAHPLQPYININLRCVATKTFPVEKGKGHQTECKPDFFLSAIVQIAISAITQHYKHS